MKVVYMGTPDFAVNTLEAIVNAGHEIMLVVTQPDKAKGRGKKVVFTPVKEKALEYGLTVSQPEKVSEESFVANLRQMNPDVIVVVAFGQILPESILNIPKYGCINVHASLLPAYRGAAPIQWAVIDGLAESGVTTMYMEKGLDTGDIILQSTIPLAENETGGSLFDKLAVEGADLLIETLKQLENGLATRTKQDDSKSSYAKMLDKSLSKIDWNLKAFEVHNKIRGLDPWPVALTIFDGKNLKLFRSRLLNKEFDKPAGSVFPSKEGIIVVCGDKNAILITEVQLEGKKRMSAIDFSRGNKLTDGTIFEN